MPSTPAAALCTAQAARRPSDLHLRKPARRPPSPNTTRRLRLQLCPPLSHAPEARDLLSASPVQTIASLRLLVLSYLENLEHRLSELDHFGEHTMEEARQGTTTALEMLEGIRAEVRSRLPELHPPHMSMEAFVKSHLPDLPDVTSLTDMCSHLPDMPDVRSHLPDIPEMRSHLPHLSDVRSKLDDVYSRIQDIDFHQPLRYIPTLSYRLKKLHSHLTSVEVPPGVSSSSLTPGTLLSDLLDALLTSEIVTDLLNTAPDVIEGEEVLEKVVHQAANAIQRSLRGVRLIGYADLPHPWKNNPFVIQGYRSGLNSLRKSFN
jgi:adiponectin receptor